MSDNNNLELELQDWTAALESLVAIDGKQVASQLLTRLLDFGSCELDLKLDKARINTEYTNTISLVNQPDYPGDLELERKLRAYIRWNALAMVMRAGRIDSSLGGHIGTYASAATLYEVGFNHFWRADQDLVFMQGHASPGIYARSFLEGRLTSTDLMHFRRELQRTDNGVGLSSYPHPYLMPEYWQFPTVSMGLGPIQAIYQAKFLRYLEARGLTRGPKRYVWCFCGDGEMDEPESIGALSIAAREGLDNLIFVINCNLQRLDGPVRGNGKIIQELEGIFHGAGWQVLKVIWGDKWDQLLNNADPSVVQLLKKRMLETVDGDYQNYAAHGGQFIREHFFAKYPELNNLIQNYSDQDLHRLNRGGHDPKKVYAAYHTAINTVGKPTVILAKTIKGYGLGHAGEGLNVAHNTKKLTQDQINNFCARFRLELPSKVKDNLEFYRPKEDSDVMQYLQARRAKLNGYLPKRRSKASNSLISPKLNSEIYNSQLQGSEDRKISTTMSFVRILVALCRDKDIGKYIVPIVADEARSFGMEGLFRQFGIYSPVGQKYDPVDKSQVMFYKETKNGQILQEGLNEAGAFSSWLAAATSYSVSDQITLPFYIYYSMFGFQRIGDLIWAAGDSRARGFLIGATAGRTTLPGEGLQHGDGHSHLLASTVENCISYDPAYGYELAVIIATGVERMAVKQADVFYYITCVNENYLQPPIAADDQDKIAIGIIAGMYKFTAIKAKNNSIDNRNTQLILFGSGAILNEIIKAGQELATQYNLSSIIYSVTSYTELFREAKLAEKNNKIPYITDILKQDINADKKLLIVAASDYVVAMPEQVRPYLPISNNSEYVTLGTDGFGRSDTRAALRNHFGVDSKNIVNTVLQKLK